ncbi:MAG: RluA family pseudouridine synthase [Rubrivivax sp.]
MERPFFVHVDPHLVVVDKPAGLPSVPGRTPELQDCAATRVQAVYEDALVVHRLDMATSGLLMFARGLQAQRFLHRAFESRQVEKVYEAMVKGSLSPMKGSIDLPLIVDWPRRPRQIVDHDRGKPSLTHWEVLEPTRPPGPLEAQGLDCTRVQLRPVTGRSHQLRVHLAALGHPMLGDDLYADEHTRGRSDRLLLHATGLAVPHPQSQQTLRLHSTVPF